MINSGEPIQNSIGFFQLSSDPTKFVFAATRGSYETDAKGFRVVGLIKDSTATWIKSYSLPDTYLYQMSTCSAIDPQDNLWIGGHVFETSSSYGKPFLVKLDKSGNILWSRTLADSAHTGRGLAIKNLHNGDIAYLTYDTYSFCLFRISPTGDVVWSKNISGVDSLVFEPSVNLFQNTLYNSHMLAESSDGNIFFACTSNYPVSGKDCLVKFTGDGNFVFAKTFLWPNNIPCFPPQIQITENDDIVCADQKNVGIATGTLGHPYLFIVSQNGIVKKSKAFPVDQEPYDWYAINEMNYFQQKIYITTIANYEINTYIFDQSLDLQSSIKTVGTNSFSADPGGFSLYDKSAGALLHIFDIAGLPADGNGFQFFKTDMTGKSCHVYNFPPQQLTMVDIVQTIDDIAPPVSNATKLFSEDLHWMNTPVSIALSETLCAE